MDDLGLDQDGFCLVRVDDQTELSIEMHDDSQSMILTAAVDRRPRGTTWPCCGNC